MDLPNSNIIAARKTKSSDQMIFSWQTNLFGFSSMEAGKKRQ